MVELSHIRGWHIGLGELVFGLVVGFLIAYTAYQDISNLNWALVVALFGATYALYNGTNRLFYGGRAFPRSGSDD